MIILGVDPGTIVAGYGVIRAEGEEREPLEYGVLKLGAKRPMPERLRILYDGLDDLVAKSRPEALALESAFHGKNAQSALKIGYARGTAMTVAAKRGVEVAEYAPREIKKAVVGSGAAAKAQVAFMARTLLAISDDDLPEDATDALAVALCHAVRKDAPETTSRGWAAFVESNPERVEE
jgi:crossover junction endodeoxyribonuclease RuvC